jgi:hypothetical protein
MALRHLTDRKAGIRMGGHWYCSSACFATAAEEKLIQQLKPVPVRKHVPRMPLALVLVARGWLTDKQVHLAMNLHRETGADIREVLLWLGVVNEKQITAAQATQWGCPVFAVNKGLVRTGVQIPPTLAKLYSVMPLHHFAAKNRLLVGFVQGVEYGLLYTLEQMTGYATEPCFITPTDFVQQMQQLDKMNDLRGEGEKRASEQVFADIRMPVEMARVLCRQAIDIEADEAVIGKCRDYIWARLSNATTLVDLLFKTA